MKKYILWLLTFALFLGGCVFAPSSPLPASSTMEAHFIDVGQADCALLESEGSFILIDGGNVEDGDMVVDYLLDAGVEELEAVFCSHAHEDHVGGLADVLKTFPTKAVFAPTKTYSSNCFDQFVYYTDQQDLSIQIPKPGDKLTFGHATVTVLGPVDSYSDVNNTSLVLRVQFGDTRFLFTGDMELPAETDLLDAGTDLKADLLKVGHHGSDTSTGYRFLKEVAPDYAVISVGANNSYGHPNDDPLSRLQDAEVSVYRTDKLGSITAISNGTDITVTWENTSGHPSVPDGGHTEATGHPTENQLYIGNVSSKVFHLPTCTSLPSEKNQIQFYSYAEAAEAEYRPCSRCLE